MYLTAVRDNKKPQVDLPFKYQFYVWRSKMKIDWQTAIETPVQVIMQDLEMLALEKEYGQKHEDQNNGKQKR